jgi:quinol monooxygenase YgiN
MRVYNRRMHAGRREFMVASAWGVLGVAIPMEGASEMYGLIGKMTVVAGQRDALITILLEGTSAMPGCLSYVVAKDPTDESGVWITEVWENEASHQASLSLPSVKDAIAKGRPLIAGFGDAIVTQPVGGQGLGR